MTEKYFATLVGSFEKAGFVGSPGPELEKWFKETGFINVKAERFSVPVGMWPKGEKHVSYTQLHSVIPRSLRRTYFLTKYLENRRHMEFIAARRRPRGHSNGGVDENRGLVS